MKNGRDYTIQGDPSRIPQFQRHWVDDPLSLPDFAHFDREVAPRVVEDVGRRAIERWLGAMNPGAGGFFRGRERVSGAVHLTGEIVDNDAIEIGQLYQKAGHSLVDSVKYQIECGQRLTEKKVSMKHGQWAPWIQNNMAVLGFKTDRRPTSGLRLPN